MTGAAGDGGSDKGCKWKKLLGNSPRRCDEQGRGPIGGGREFNLEARCAYVACLDGRQGRTVQIGRARRLISAVAKPVPVLAPNLLLSLSPLGLPQMRGLFGRCAGETALDRR